MMVLNAIGESAGSALSEWHYFALVLFGYHAYFLIWKNGVSFGKFLRGICVVSVNGESLSILQSILRAALISAPYTWLSTSEIGPSVVRGQMPPILSVLSIAALWWWLADVFLVETLDGRRTLTDRVAKTMVVIFPHCNRIGRPLSLCTAQMTPSSGPSHAGLSRLVQADAGARHILCQLRAHALHEWSRRCVCC